MAEQIVVDGKIVEDVGQAADEDQTLLEKDEFDTKPVEEPNKDDFESDEDYQAAVEQHKTDNQEPWQATDDESNDVPVDTHIRMKQKLKGRISERDDENEKLKAEIAALKTSKEAPKILKRPREDDFESDEAYEAARDQYEHDAAQERYNRIETESRQKESQEQAQTTVNDAVNSHYERADKLITESGIKPEIYKKADETVRLAVETLLPKTGDMVVDQLISIVGEGSEKVLYYLGNNKAALNEFKSLLIDDKSGMKAAIYLGQQKERLTNPKKRTTRAPTPGPQLKGDDVSNAQGTALKKSYDKAHKSGNIQAAYNAKKAALSAGVNVSSW